MDARLVPINLMAWPRVRDLLPDQKLIVYHLWATCREGGGLPVTRLGRLPGRGFHHRPGHPSGS